MKRPNSPTSRIPQTAAAAASGLLLTAAFPKIDAAWIAWIALVPLLFAVRGATPARAFKLGWIAGLAHYLTLLYWVVPTMRIYGHLPLYLCIPVLFLFSASLAVYTGTFTWLGALPGSGARWRYAVLPFFWVTLEWLRSFLFTGFPWALLGHSQYRVLPLVQIADLFGVYGVSFVIVLCNTALYRTTALAAGRKVTRGWARPAAGWTLAAVAGFSMTWIYGSVRIAAVDRITQAAVSRPVAVVQGNIDQAAKWVPAFQRATIDKYTRLSASVRAENPALVIWPETAAPFYFLADRQLTQRVQDAVRTAGTYYLVGSNSMEQAGNRPVYYNSAYLVAPDGTVAGRYDKVHLVPYGEYVPFKKWLPFLGKMVAHVGDFRPGTQGDTLPWPDGALGVLICYEVIFPNLSRQMTANGASVLINMTNDAWYGRSSAPYQHFSMAVFRAVENRRYLVRAANTGISGFIDPAGRVQHATALYTDAAVTRQIRLLSSLTVYTRYGDLFAVGALLVCLIALTRAAAARKRRRQKRVAQ